MNQLLVAYSCLNSISLKEGAGHTVIPDETDQIVDGLRTEDSTYRDISFFQPINHFRFIFLCDEISMSLTKMSFVHVN